jgi:hypothetical protein
MMKQWFEAKVRYQKVTESGMEKKTTETFLVDSLSFTESESRTIEEVSPYIKGEFTIPAIKKSNITEVFDDSEEHEGDAYWRIKCDFLTLDERSGAEKRSPQYFLLKAPGYDKVIPMFVERMKGSMADYEVVEEVKPLKKCWKGRDGKITHEELARFTGLMGHTNQDGRDAALLAWVRAGLPIRL